MHVVNHAVLVGLCTAEDVGAVAVVHDGANGARYRNTRLKAMIVLRPLVAESLDLLALLNVERFARLVRFESGRHEVHALLRSPAGRRDSGDAPPHSVATPLGMTH